MSILDIVILLVVVGIIAFLIQRAPFIDEPYKSWALYALLVFVAIAIIVMVLGGSSVLTKRFTIN